MDFIYRRGFGFIFGVLMITVLATLANYKVNWDNLSVVGDDNVVIAEASDITKDYSWTGEDVIKLALSASKGDIILVVDGIQIDSEEDLEATNLRGMIGAKYTVQSVMDESLQRKVVVANIKQVP